MTIATATDRPQAPRAEHDRAFNVAVFGCDPAVHDSPRETFDRTIDVLRRARRAASADLRFELVYCAAEAAVRVLEPGIVAYALAAHCQPSTPRTAVSWGAVERVAACDLVHLWLFDQRLCDVAMLAAKLGRKPIVVSDVEPDFATLASQLGLETMADRVVCRRDLATPDAGETLWRTYERFLPAVRPAREAAA